MGKAAIPSFGGKQGLRETTNIGLYTPDGNAGKNFPITHLNISQVMDLVEGRVHSHDEDGFSVWDLRPGGKPQRRRGLLRETEVPPVQVYYLQFRNDFLPGLKISNINRLPAVVSAIRSTAWTLVLPVVIDWDGQIDPDTCLLKPPPERTVSVKLVEDQNTVRMEGKTYRLVEV